MEFKYVSGKVSGKIIFPYTSQKYRQIAMEKCQYKDLNNSVAPGNLQNNPENTKSTALINYIMEKI